MVKKDAEDLKYEAQLRKERMDALEVRIARTAAGERFLDRLYEIRKIKPLHSEPEEGE